MDRVSGSEFTADGIQFDLYEQSDITYGGSLNVVRLLGLWSETQPPFPDDMTIPSGALQVKYIEGYRLSIVFLSAESPCEWSDSDRVLNGLKYHYNVQRDKGKHLFYALAKMENAKQIQLAISPWYGQSLASIQGSQIQLDTFAYFPNDLLTAVDAGKVFRLAVDWSRSFRPDSPLSHDVGKSFRSGLVALNFDLFDRDHKRLVWPTYGSLADFLERLPQQIPSMNSQSWPAFNGRFTVPTVESTGWLDVGGLQLSYGLTFDDTLSASNRSQSAVPNPTTSGLQNGSATY